MTRVLTRFSQIWLFLNICPLLGFDQCIYEHYSSIHDCRRRADTVFDFAAAMLFQGLTSARYIPIDDPDRSLNATAVTMLWERQADVEYACSVDLDGCVEMDGGDSWGTW